MYYTKVIEVWDKGNAVDLGGGVKVPGQLELSYSMKVDMQPYSSAQAKKDYGYDIDTTNRMFSPIMVLNIGNSIVRYLGDDYEVMEKIVWDDFIETILKRK